MDLPYWSPSQVKAMLECEGYFQAKYIHGLTETGRSEKLVVGRVIDDVLSSLVNDYLTSEFRETGDWLPLHDLSIVEAHLASELAAAETEGETWPFQSKWLGSTMALKILQTIDIYMRDVEGTRWEMAQRELSCDVFGIPFKGFLDAAYTNDNGELVIIDWKSKSRRDNLDFMHRIQLSCYAWAMNTQLVEAHYIVPWTKEPGVIIHKTTRLPREIIEPYLSRRAELLGGSTPVLNPSSWRCGKACPAIHTCIVGQWKAADVTSYAA